MRKPSILAIVKGLHQSGVKVRVTQLADGTTVVDTLGAGDDELPTMALREMGAARADKLLDGAFSQGVRQSGKLQRSAR